MLNLAIAAAASLLVVCYSLITWRFTDQIEVNPDKTFDNYESNPKQLLSCGESSNCHNALQLPPSQIFGMASGCFYTLVPRPDGCYAIAFDAKYRAIFGSANDSILPQRIVEMNGDTEFILHDLNRKGCELWGYSRENILSGNFDLLEMDDPPHTFEEATRRNPACRGGTTAVAQLAAQTRKRFNNFGRDQPASHAHRQRGFPACGDARYDRTQNHGANLRRSRTRDALARSILAGYERRFSPTDKRFCLHALCFSEYLGYLRRVSAKRRRR
jgi:hypothetical protein